MQNRWSGAHVELVLDVDGIQVAREARFWKHSQGHCQKGLDVTAAPWEVSNT